MTVAEVGCVVGLAALVVIVGLRPHGWGLALGPLVGVAIAAATGAVESTDLRHAAEVQWRPFVTLTSIMTMTAAAERIGLLDRLAALIEPRTRGPVRHAFGVTFVLSALVAAVLSNDAAILLLTPAVLTLLRTVYPRRNPKFLTPFAFAIFAAAGVAPLVISNPMNLVFADHAGIGFNAYAATMIPVAVAGWVVAYLLLSWCFRGPLADQAPALGAWPGPPPRLGTGGRVVLTVLIAVLLAYPVVAYLDGPLWVVAAIAAAICVVTCAAAGIAPLEVARGVAWSVFPFLVGVFVLALGFERIGVVDRLATLYRDTGAPVLVVGVTSALGSALLNNHPMSLLNALALDRVATAGDVQVFAALIGGDLGPRLLPMGSLAGLLWFDSLRRHGVTVSLGQFVRVGLVVTVPTLAISLGLLWLIAG